MRDINISQATKQFLSNTALSYIGVLVSVIISIFQVEIIDVIHGTVLAIVLLLVIGVTQYYNTYRPLLQYRDKQLSTFLENYLSTVESEIEACAADSVSIRCNVMRPTSDSLLDDDYLTISFVTDADQYRSDELQLQFSSGQGCVGTVYSQGKQHLAVREERGEWPDGFETTARQDNATSHLDVIIGTPIYRSNDDPTEATPIAVLIADSESQVADVFDLDDNEPINDLSLKQTQVCEQLADYSDRIGILL
jgi:hypothetical protein